MVASFTRTTSENNACACALAHRVHLEKTRARKGPKTHPSLFATNRVAAARSYNKAGERTALLALAAHLQQQRVPSVQPSKQ